MHGFDESSKSVTWALGEGLPEVERVKGIEPSYEAWKASVLPLNYTRFRYDGEFIG